MPIQCQPIKWSHVDLLSMGPIENKLQWKFNQNTILFIWENVLGSMCLVEIDDVMMCINEIMWNHHIYIVHVLAWEIP